ncbi:MAG: hypothetical protein ACLPJH_18685 [Myxococcaceae bacterium]
MSSRWERLLEQKPIPLLEHLLDEVARLLQSELRAWPLSVQELDVATGRGFAELLTPGRPRPADAVFTEALRLARWDLERSTDAVDDYFRNHRYRQAGLGETDRPALLLVSRWLVEQLLSLGEATTGRVKRKEMVAVLGRLAAASAPG